MSALREQHCTPVEKGAEPLDGPQANTLLAQLGDWQLAEDAGAISRTFRFDNFYQTIAFVNALAWIANQEDHHPDLEVGYSRCTVHYSTHAAHGLTLNDFICAAKIDALFDR